MATPLPNPAQVLSILQTEGLCHSEEASLQIVNGVLCLSGTVRPTDTSLDAFVSANRGRAITGLVLTTSSNRRIGERPIVDG